MLVKRLNRIVKGWKDESRKIFEYKIKYGIKTVFYCILLGASN